MDMETNFPSLDDMNNRFESLIARVKSMGKASSAIPANDDAILPSLQSDLLALKSIHRKLYAALTSAEHVHQERRHQQERFQQARAALQYERKALLRDIAACRAYQTPYLNQLARDELNSTNEQQQQQTLELTDSVALTVFFQADLHDPSQRQHVLTRLHQEINARGELERDLIAKKKELKVIKAKYLQKKKFLDSLPDQLAAVERASLPLQKFCATQMFETVALLGSERRNRLDRAQALPPPLYTLFYQLQSYVDKPIMNTKESATNSNNLLTISVTGEQDPSAVAGGDASYTTTVGAMESPTVSPQYISLQLPVPDVSSATSTATVRSKRVTLHFAYHPAKQVVTAVATGCATTLNQDVLLADLFSHDDFPLPILPSGAGATTNSGAWTSGRPYHWCNYLAGLHNVESSPAVEPAGAVKARTLTAKSDFPTESNTASRHVSTRVILRQLRRRIRANATLKHILQSLQRNQIPTLPKTPESTLNAIASSLAGSTGRTCKLVAFEPVKPATTSTEDLSSSVLERNFVAKIRQGVRTLMGHVTVHMARYPAVPPAWKLQEQDDKQSAQHDGGDLYNEDLAKHEHRVNWELLNQMMNAFLQPDVPSAPTAEKNGGEDPVGHPKEEEEMYEWILVMQLRFLMMAWAGQVESEATVRQNHKRAHDAMEE